MTNSYELGPIRPPSEAYSLLVRVTRNCPWNRCRFCHLYKGARFELRPVAVIKQEIETARLICEQIREIGRQNGIDDMREAAAVALQSASDNASYQIALWQYAGGENVFLQDANSLLMPVDQLAEVLRLLKTTFPDIKRITSYARAHTAARRKPKELQLLREAGLSRIHIGLEYGYDPLLQFMDKGVTAADHIKAGRNVVESGISLSEYVILGLGGQAMWQGHAIETARVLNAIQPDFIRIRTLTVKKGMPLFDDVVAGNFIRLTDDEIAQEERLFLANLECATNLVSDHVTNLFQEIEGRLPEAKAEFLAIIDSYLALPDSERLLFKFGRRMGVFQRLADMADPVKRGEVERFVDKAYSSGRPLNDVTVQQLMERFI